MIRPRSLRHARNTLAAALTTVALAGTTVLAAAPADATVSFPGAGFVVRGVSGIATTFTVPKVTCTSGENSAVVLGLMGTAVGTGAGWNAAVVEGCAVGHPWYRIQTWVNALGGGYSIGEARAGDVVQCRLIYAKSHSPLLQTWNQTRNVMARYHLHVPATTAVAGAYSGAFVPKFATPMMKTMANHKPLSKMDRTRKDQWRSGHKLISGGYLSSDGYQHAIRWQHH